MGRYLHHRGPDAWGEWLSEAVALGHNRLAILDIGGGSQPMTCASGEHVIVFNGEIYNFREIRAAIKAAGGALRTDHSDTEAIVEGFRLWGGQVFARLDGMFACAIWTPATRQLVLARDRLGIKPLYHCAMRDGGLAFASEPKALIGSGVIEPTLNDERLDEYFLFRAPLHPETLFRGIRSVAPGSLLRYDVASKVAVVHRFFDFASLINVARAMDLEGTLACINDAVNSQLVADVEVGVFLSGGVDSSLVTALASKSRRVRTFNISTGGPLDEFEFARSVADHVGADFHSRSVSPADMLGHMDEWAYFNDDPVADPSALALMLLASDVHDHGLKVMLAGEGADELFGGYRAYLRFLAARAVSDRAGSLPVRATRLLGETTSEYLGSDRSPYWGTAHVTTQSMRHELLGRKSQRLEDRILQESAGLSHLRQALIVDQRLRLPNDLLMRTDRATMAYSVEARVPFLANAVLDASWRVPNADLCRLLPPANKPLLKSIAARVVPRECVYRRKIGFDLPIAAWLAQDFKPRIEAMLAERRLPVLNYDTVSAWYSSLTSGSARMAAPLWAWFVLELWFRQWIERSTPPRVS